MKKRTLEEVCEYFEMYGAIDKDGYTCLYNSKPAILDNDAWCSTDDNTFLEASRLIVPSECDWKDSLYTPKALRPEYEPYTKPDLKWLDLYLDDTEGACHCIAAVGLDYVVFDDGMCVPFRELLDYKLEGKPFGEEIK